MPIDDMNTLINKNIREIRTRNIQLERENAQIELLRILEENGVITLQQRAEYANMIMQKTLDIEIKAVA